MNEQGTGPRRRRVPVFGTIVIAALSLTGCTHAANPVIEQFLVDFTRSALAAWLL